MLEFTYSSLMVRGVAKIVFSFMKLETQDSDLVLIKNYERFQNVNPENLGVDEYFTLNKYSPLRKEAMKQSTV